VHAFFSPFPMPLITSIAKRKFIKFL
jgi:hypothetical protein